MKNEKTYEQLKRDFELERQTNGRQGGEALQELARAIALSVLAKVIDPRRKTGDKPNGNGSGQSRPLLAARDDVRKGLLERTRRQALVASKATQTDDGDGVTVYDKKQDKALSDLLTQACGDGVDLVQEAACLLLEAEAEAEKRLGAPLPVGWLEMPYTIKKLSKRVVIKDAAAAWKEADTTPIEEVYKGVRGLIGQSGGVTIDPRCKFIYVDDLATDESGAEDVIYRRYGKMSDIGGYVVDYNGKQTVYTAGAATAAELAGLVEKLNLGGRQAEYLKRRLQGYGYKAIGTAYNVSQQAVANSMKLVQKKAEKLDFTPAAVAMARAAADDDHAEVVADLIWAMVAKSLQG